MKMKRLLGVLLGIAIMLVLMLGLSVTAYADGTSYLDENGVQQTASSATSVGSSTTTWTNGWYVVSGDVTINSRITVSGTVNLILADNKTLNANAGIQVASGNSLTIYAQSTGDNMGALNATGSEDDYAGIGGDFGEEFGTITINGGSVTATGSLSTAGIGGGYWGGGGTITINGGTVTATAGAYAQGIGEGYEGEENEGSSTIIIGNGVTVYAGDSADSATLVTDLDDFIANHTENYVMMTSGASAYDVTITAGANMTKTTDSGDASQSDLSDEMVPVVYTANDGYYFPTDYSVDEVNGISVTRDGYTQITVSGTPTADVEITLTAPTAKTTPDAPTTAAAVDCTTADNDDGKLTGVTTAMEYKEANAASWTDGTGNDITGLVPGTYYVRVKATDTTNASANQELTIADYLFVTKTAAKGELDTLLAGKTEADYDEDDWTALTQAITDGKADIDNADTTDAIATAKSNAVDAVNAIKTKAEKAAEALAAAKTEASATVNDVNADAYIADDQQTVADAKTTALAAINAAATEAEVTAALEAFNEAIAECTTQAAVDLATAKTEATATVNDVNAGAYIADDQ